ncbi:MAG: LysE family translocator [Pseudomonadota bacterium]
MPGPELLLPFLATALILSITPGPGMLYMAAQTVGRGRKAGLYSALGTHFASYLHILAAAFGLSLILDAVPLAYLAVKVVGAGYLFWLGASFLFSGGSEIGSTSVEHPRQHLKALKESFVVELTNPKSALFFIAFLPQFTDPDESFSIPVQIIALGMIANLVFSAAEVGSVYCASTISAFLRRSRSSARWMRRLAGTIMIALGVKLLISER